MTYLKVKPNVTFCPCWRSSGAEQLPCKQWVGGSNPPASASFFEELPGAAGGFGEVPKWPKGADCKSAGVRLRGFKSSPPHHVTGCQEPGADRGWPETGATKRGTRVSALGERGALPARGVRFRGRRMKEVFVVLQSGGNSSAVERQPSKLGVAGSNPVSRSRSRVCAHVAQSAERVLGKDEVSGSIPDMGSRTDRRATARTTWICEPQDVAGLGPAGRGEHKVSVIATANGRV